MGIEEFLAARPHWREGYAQVNGLNLHYVSAGQGPLMLLVHGFPEFWYCWHAQIEEFSRDYQVVAFDMRGYNLSDKPEDLAAYRIHELNADIQAMIEYFGHRSAVLVAHDWGGAVAWSFANAFPQYVDRLISINSAHHCTFARELAHNPAQQEASLYMQGFREPDAVERMSANGFAEIFENFENESHGWEMSQAEREIYIQAWSRPGALDGGLNYYRATPLVPPRPGQPNTQDSLLEYLENSGLCHIPMPTLVIWGVRDHATKIGCVRGLEEYIPNLSLVSVPECGHWIIHEQPRRVNRLMREFLSCKR